jgi:hypothetical protein
MASTRTRASRRISSFFSTTPSLDDSIPAASNTPRTTRSSEALGPVDVAAWQPPPVRKLTKDRAVSQHIAPGYPPPAPPAAGQTGQPTTTAVDDNAYTLQSPSSSSPPLLTSQSPSRGPSPPGAGRLTSDTLPTHSNDKRAKKKSWLLGGSARSSNDRVPDAGSGAGVLAWVAGHDGKVPYNLSLLLGAEKVRHFA